MTQEWPLRRSIEGEKAKKSHGGLRAKFMEKRRKNDMVGSEKREKERERDPYLHLEIKETLESQNRC